jgi:hypothetical protein
VTIAQEDLVSIQRGASLLALLARLLDVEEPLANWLATADATQGGIAADALDQARGLLEEFVGGELSTVLRAVERVASQLPPPME